MAWANVSFNVATGGACDCCGGVGGCIFLIPNDVTDGTSDPFADLAEAQDFMDTRTANCLAWLGGFIYGPRTAWSAGYSGGALSYNSVVAQDASEISLDQCVFKVNVGAATLFTVQGSLLATSTGLGAYFTQLAAQVYDSAGTLIDNNSVLSNSLSLSDSIEVTANASGEFYVYVEATGGNTVDDGGASTLTWDTNVTANLAFEPCEIQLAYTNNNATDYMTC